MACRRSSDRLVGMLVVMVEVVWLLCGSWGEDLEMWGSFFHVVARLGRDGVVWHGWSLGWWNLGGGGCRLALLCHVGVCREGVEEVDGLNAGYPELCWGQAGSGSFVAFLIGVQALANGSCDERDHVFDNGGDECRKFLNGW